LLLLLFVVVVVDSTDDVFLRFVRLFFVAEKKEFILLALRGVWIRPEAVLP